METPTSDGVTTKINTQFTSRYYTDISYTKLSAGSILNSSVNIISSQ